MICDEVAVAWKYEVLMSMICSSPKCQCMITTKKYNSSSYLLVFQIEPVCRMCSILANSIVISNSRIKRQIRSTIENT